MNWRGHVFRLAVNLEHRDIRCVRSTLCDNLYILRCRKTSQRQRVTGSKRFTIHENAVSIGNNFDYASRISNGNISCPHVGSFNIV